MRPGERRRPRLGAEIDGEEISWRSPLNAGDAALRRVDAQSAGLMPDDPQRIEWPDAASHAAWRSALFANDLDQHALAAPSVELAIKNLLPRTEVEFTRRDRDHNLPPHNLAFHMGIGIVLAGSVVTVA